MISTKREVTENSCHCTGKSFTVCLISSPNSVPTVRIGLSNVCATDTDNACKRTAEPVAVEKMKTLSHVEGIRPTNIHVKHESQR